MPDTIQNPPDSLEARAARFAEAAHASIDQRRKYSGEPYIVHPQRVAEMLRGVPHTEAMLAAAWLHDTVEDTPVTLAEVEAEFGEEVAALVEQLTDVSRPGEGNRATRRELDRAHTAVATPAAKTVKLADLIDNARCIIAGDAGFARIFMAEMVLLLQVLQEGDPRLLAQATELTADYFRSQGDEA
ncbi:HD domain-containing protein [Niveibacterium sp. 24ML]|uniref:HD domain-containing protein n=1 Tax=Niveibacterium sp. 24ML TaxID=2985512 RepID=UPI0022708970|nr:HD domain-containing protein [Niveibacterium sp. 24ML]MCX9155783.1 HD domain-containing protein [Niveibacterium sp. 24ML]